MGISSVWSKLDQCNKGTSLLRNTCTCAELGNSLRVIVFLRNAGHVLGLYNACTSLPIGTTSANSMESDLGCRGSTFIT